jgi:hypothetical protein
MSSRGVGYLGGGETNVVVYKSRRNDEIGSIKIFRSFNLCQVSAIYLEIRRFIILFRGTRWSSRLRHCATSRKAAGSIPDCVTGIFHQHNPSGRTTALGLTQPLKKRVPG